MSGRARSRSSASPSFHGALPQLTASGEQAAAHRAEGTATETVYGFTEPRRGDVLSTYGILTRYGILQAPNVARQQGPGGTERAVHLHLHL